jgi:hypothetical protein
MKKWIVSTAVALAALFAVGEARAEGGVVLGADRSKPNRHHLRGPFQHSVACEYNDGRRRSTRHQRYPVRHDLEIEHGRMAIW